MERENDDWNVNAISKNKKNGTLFEFFRVPHNPDILWQKKPVIVPHFLQVGGGNCTLNYKGGFLSEYLKLPSLGSVRRLYQLQVDM